MLERFEVVYETDEDDDERNNLVVKVDGKEIRRECDGCAPEDNTFGRSWCWVGGAIEDAYKIGFEHGKENQDGNK